MSPAPPNPTPLDYAVDPHRALSGPRYAIIITIVWTLGLASWVFWLAMLILLLNRFFG